MKAVNEGAACERRKPTNEGMNEGTKLSTKDLRNLLFDERRNLRTNE